MRQLAPLCRAARGEAEGWKARTLQAESQIAELKLQVKDCRMQLGLPITDSDSSSAAPVALTWHQSDRTPEIGEYLVHHACRGTPFGEAVTLAHCVNAPQDAPATVSAGCDVEGCEPVRLCKKRLF